MDGVARDCFVRGGVYICHQALNQANPIHTQLVEVTHLGAKATTPQ